MRPITDSWARWGWLLGISLALNLAFGAWLARLLRPSSTPAGNDIAVAASPVLPSLRKPGSSVRVVTNALPVEFRWRVVQSADPREYVSNLRAIGCPEPVIQDIILGEHQTTLRERFGGLPGSSATAREYWRKPVSRPGTLDPSQEPYRLGDEPRELWRSLFGTDAPTAAAADLSQLRLDPRELHLAFLPADKRTAATAVIRELRELEFAQASRLSDPDAPIDSARAELDQSLRTVLAGVLSPAELEEYVLRTDETAAGLRRQLATFRMTPQEFRSLFRARETAGAEFPAPEDDEKRHQREEELARAEFRADRYAQFVKQLDWAYVHAYQLARRDSLPVTVADDIIQVRRTAEQAAAAVRENPDLPPEDRTATLQDIRKETEQTVRRALGARAFDSYRKGGGAWLTTLSLAP